MACLRKSVEEKVTFLVDRCLCRVVGFGLRVFFQRRRKRSELEAYSSEFDEEEKGEKDRYKRQNRRTIDDNKYK